MGNLTLLAGAQAIRHIRRDGLHPSGIQAVFGASGSAKWLSIYGLDDAVFSSWLSDVDYEGSGHRIDLFGTSIGAWKLAVAAQADPHQTLYEFSEAYIDQSYRRRPTRADIQSESDKIIRRCMGKNAVEQVLSHPGFRFNCGAIRCRGMLASENRMLQGLAMAKAFWDNRRGRNGLCAYFERVVFHDPRAEAAIAAQDQYQTHCYALSRENFTQALLASGSIPLWMYAVKNIAGVDPGVYRDGGLLDYHPVPGYLRSQSGLVLYPHFYPHLYPGWFDKYYGKRYGTTDLLENVLLLAPTPKYVESLPLGRLSDRKDFEYFAGRNDERQENWRRCRDMSIALGDEFLELIQNQGKLIDRLQLISDPA